MRTECSELKSSRFRFNVSFVDWMSLFINLSLRVHNHIGKENEARSTGSVADPAPEIKGGGDGGRSISKNVSPFGPLFGLKIRGPSPRCAPEDPQ